MKKQYTTREFRTLLSNNGFHLVSSNGDHFKYKKENTTVVVPVVGKEMNRMLARRLVKEHNLVTTN